MNFLNVHEEVVEGHILPFLQWNDLLRFRRVCRTFHGITGTYLKVHPELAPELEVNEEDKTITSFLQMNIPTTKLFINNELSGHDYFQENKEDLKELVKKYGKVIKCLKLTELALHLFDYQWDFMNGLKCLESLEADHLGDVFAAMDPDEVANILQRYPAHYPSTLMALKRLKIGQEKYQPIPNVVLNCMVILHFCSKLEHVSLPFNYELENDDDDERVSAAFRYWLSDPMRAMAFSFFNLNGVIKHGMRQGTNYLKTVDFWSYHDEDCKEVKAELEEVGTREFVPFCVTCLENGIKVTNVGATWFNYKPEPGTPPRVFYSEVGNVVVSMINVHPAVFTLEMDNLERIDVRKTSQCDTELEPGQSRPHWPALKTLNINVDFDTSLKEKSAAGMMKRVTNALNTKQLFNFFFKNIRHIGLTSLWLNFEDNDISEVVTPKTEDVVNACPNLKKLTIVNWHGTNKNLVKLWDGLPGLEEVCLVECKQLGNVAFVGEDRDNPVFFKLKNLRKLSLKGLDQMPKITDTLFSLVIRHMKLTQLILTSATPVSSISKVGLESLLTGRFADSIEKFPFNRWSLQDVSPEEFKAIQIKFRSYDMI